MATDAIHGMDIPTNRHVFLTAEAERVLNTLTTAMERAADGRGSVIMLPGASGCGKSFLASQFAAKVVMISGARDGARQIGVMTAVGSALGVVTALLVGRAAQAVLFELPFYDPVVLGSSIAVLAVVALAAGAVPAHRAAGIDPVRALKFE